ncbi:MAG: hypothetical protein SFW07_04835 [Gammaproteobacteria bacterium]|nr:hypothetical protein [Gammaproteobacteria bacterium]
MSGENKESVELYELERGYQARPAQVFTPPRERNVRMSSEGLPQNSGGEDAVVDFATDGDGNVDGERSQPTERQSLLTTGIRLESTQEQQEDVVALYPSVNASRCHSGSDIYRKFVTLVAQDLHKQLPAKTPERLKHFTQGSIFVLNKLWAPAFWGMFLHDLIVYGAYPLERYGTTFGQLWIGTATNHITLTSNFSNDLAGTLAHSLLPAVVTASIPAGGLIWVFEPSRAFISNIFSATLGNVGNKIPEGIKGLYAKNVYKNYLAWKNGKEAPDGEAPRLAVKIARDVFFLPFVMAVFYANLRLILLDIFKIIGLHNYLDARDACLAQNKSYAYLNDYGKYECVVVTWEFIADGLKFTNQDALKGLLESSHDPDFINSKLDELFRSTPYFQEFDLSGQNWKQWTPAQWNALLTKVSSHVTQLQRLSLGAPVPNNFFPTDGFMEELVGFLQNVNTSELIMPNQGLGDTQFNKLTPVLSEFSEINVNSDQLKSIGGLANHTQSLTKVKVSGNAIQNFGMQVIASEIAKPESVLEQIEAAGIGMDENGLAQLSTALPGRNVRKIVLGDEDDLSQADFGVFGTAVAEGDVETVVVRQARLDDNQVVNFVTQSKNGNLESLDFSGNDIGNDGAIGVVVASEGGSLQVVKLNDNQDIDDTGALGMASHLAQTNITEVGVGGTQVTSVGIKSLIEVKTLKAIDVSNSPIGDDVAAVFSTTPTNVEKIKLANTQLTSIGAESLAQALRTHLANVTTLDISGNNLPDDAVAEIVSALKDSKITKLNLEGNAVGLNATAALVDVLPQIPINNLNLRNTQLSDECGAAIARALIEPTPHSEQIGNSDIDLDEIRAVREAKQTTSLIKLDISNNPTGRVTKIAFRQVLPSTNITEFLSNSTGVSRSTSDFFASRSSFHSSARAFSGAALSSTASNFSQPLLAGSSNSMSSSHVALGALAAGPIILIFLLLIYLLYRLCRKNGEDSSCKTLSRTSTRR